MRLKVRRFGASGNVPRKVEDLERDLQQIGCHIVRGPNNRPLRNADGSFDIEIPFRGRDRKAREIKVREILNAHSWAIQK